LTVWLDAVITGGLITTVATGRGVSVLDFLCLNQRKETLIAVIEHFKELNPTWAGVQSVVIDKDFAEWKALEEVLPTAKVLYSLSCIANVRH
jgi:hypothetical protein